jgi:hypothetical protein
MKKLFTISLILLFSSFVFAQDWPQYMGPDRNSISPQKNLLRSWPESGPEVLWRVDVVLLVICIVSIWKPINRFGKPMFGQILAVSFPKEADRVWAEGDFPPGPFRNAR